VLIARADCSGSLLRVARSAEARATSTFTSSCAPCPEHNCAWRASCFRSGESGENRPHHHMPSRVVVLRPLHAPPPPPPPPKKKPPRRRLRLFQFTAGAHFSANQEGSLRQAGEAWAPFIARLHRSGVFSTAIMSVYILGSGREGMQKAWRTASWGWSSPPLKKLWRKWSQNCARVVIRPTQRLDDVSNMWRN